METLQAHELMHLQVECLVNGKLPSNLSNVIVFTRAGLTQLHNRIGELEEEKVSLKQQQVCPRRLLLRYHSSALNSDFRLRFDASTSP
jgi:hypothetical protein